MDTTDADILEALADAALRLAAEQDWSALSLREIADAAEAPLDRVYGVVRSKADIIDAIAVRFDRAAARGLELEPGASARERVFDAAMARFDAMEPHRAALASIVKGARGDPAYAARGLAMLSRTSRWLLELAGVDTSGMAGFARAKGFSAILARVGRVWLKDEGGDLSRTMASLDRALRDVEDWAERWPFSGRRRARTRDADAA